MKHIVRTDGWLGIEWRVIEVAPKSAAGLIRRLQRYPEDVTVLVEDLPKEWHAEMASAGLKFQYSITDIAWVVVGPKQMDRVRRLRPVRVA